MKATIDRLLESHAPGSNPYLRALEDGALTQEDFLETQMPPCFAV